MAIYPGILDYKRERIVSPSYPTTDLQFQLQFEDNYADDSGNSVSTAMLTGESSYISYASGLINKCITFPNRNTTGIKATYTAEGAFTIAFWVKTTDLTDGLLCELSSGTKFWQIGYDQVTAGCPRLSVYVSGWSANDGPAINDGAWHFIAGTYDNSGNSKLYVDDPAGGADVTVTGKSGPFNGSIIYIANGRDMNYAVRNESIDQLRFYSRVLSASELSQLYNSGTGI